MLYTHDQAGFLDITSNNETSDLELRFQLLPFGGDAGFFPIQACCNRSPADGLAP